MENKTPNSDPKQFGIIACGVCVAADPKYRNVRHLIAAYFHIENQLLIDQQKLKLCLKKVI